MLLNSPGASEENEDIVVIDKDGQRLASEDVDDSDNSLNRRSDKKTSIEKLKS